MITVAMVLLSLSSGLARAQDTDRMTAGLEKRVKQLEQKVAQLEALLLNGQTPKTRSEPSSSGNWRNKDNWRSLQKGMTKLQVTQLLGEPPKVNVDSYGDTWYYPNALGGQVSFSDSDLLKTWSEP
jgi:hypothetical protein